MVVSPFREMSSSEEEEATQGDALCQTTRKSDRRKPPSLVPQISYDVPLKKNRSVCNSIIQQSLKVRYGKIQCHYLALDKPKAD